jgi:prepilin-type N-terminal cleavage/methylation domain-containing protein
MQWNNFMSTAKRKKSTNKESGFTLVELSIVTVIIGLVVAGVVAGSSLTRQAQLRKAVTQVNQIKAAYNSYMLQYNALPGDHNQATNYWGTAGDCTAVDPSVTATCNGDGNNIWRI